MSGAIINLIIQLLSGAAGGNLAGAILKNFSLGPVGNTVAGVLGGGIGGQILGSLLGGGMGAAASGGLDLGAIVGQIASGGVGGGILMLVIGILKSVFAGQRA
jgi:hypothetical protein